MTTLALAIGFGIPLIGLTSFPPRFQVLRFGMVIVPLALTIICAFFTVRGYTLDGRKLIIHRMGWATRIDLTSLVSAAYQPSALKSSIRLFGNGGFFAFSGLYRNRTLGNYRMFATDLRRSVILRFPDSVIVVTPAAPETFVVEIMKLK